MTTTEATPDELVEYLSLASRDLRALVDAGQLVPHGERRGRHYLASERLKNARDQTRLAAEVTDPFVARVSPL